MPFDKLVEELWPERSLGHNPIVQVLFVMQNIPRTRKELAGLELSVFEMPLHAPSLTSPCSWSRPSRDYGHWVYSTDLFDHATILRMSRQYEALLTNAVHDADTRIAALDLVSLKEKEERGAEVRDRKKSLVKQLMAVAPQGVTLASSNRSDQSDS